MGNLIEKSKEKIQRLIEKKRKLIHERIELEYTILGITNYRTYVGDTYCEQLYQKLTKNLTKEEKDMASKRRSDIKKMCRKPYNSYNAILLEKKVQAIKAIKGQITREKQFLDKLVEEQKKAERNEIITTKELFNKDCYWDLTDDERELYNRKNERAKEELKRMKQGKGLYKKNKKKTKNILTKEKQ